MIWCYLGNNIAVAPSQIGVRVGLYLRSFEDKGDAWYGRVSRIFAAVPN